MKIDSNITDLELYLNLGQNNIKAFEELYARYKKPLLVYALRKVDAIAAEDLVHDLFVKLWAKRSEITISENFSSYIFRTLRNQILDFIAHSAQVQKYLSSLEDFSLQYFSDKADYKIREEMFLQNIDALLLKYGTRSQSIVRLRMQGFSNPEIAEKLGISEKTVRNQYSILIKHLKDKLPLLIFIYFQ